MKKQNVLVLGGGGREHALCWKLSQSPELNELYCIPGNAGIQKIAHISNSFDMMDFQAVKNFAKDKKVSLLIVGKENPLVKGIADFFTNSEIKVFGPNQHAAQLEGSKIFTKNFFVKYNIPTAKFHTFFTLDDALYHIKTNHDYPIVIKADGLAQGKGVMIAREEKEALHSIKEMMEFKKFKSAGEKIVIEEFLDGHELSYQIFLDKGEYINLIPSQDYKKAYDGNLGPNTGGMGNVAPPSWLNEDITKKIKDQVVKKLIYALHMEEIHYTGVLFLGIMIVKGDPFVLEINVRFGDPESQVIMPLLKSDLLTVTNQICSGHIKDVQLDWSKDIATCIVLSSKGYPDFFEKGKEIKGLHDVAKMENVFLFHAGTTIIDEKVYTNGGRVMSVVGLGKSWEESRKKAYEAVSKISYEGMFYRKDIGL